MSEQEAHREGLRHTRLRVRGLHSGWCRGLDGVVHHGPLDDGWGVLGGRLVPGGLAAHRTCSEQKDSEQSEGSATQRWRERCGDASSHEHGTARLRSKTIECPTAGTEKRGARRDDRAVCITTTRVSTSSVGPDFCLARLPGSGGGRWSSAPPGQFSTPHRSDERARNRCFRSRSAPLRPRA